MPLNSTYMVDMSAAAEHAPEPLSALQLLSVIQVAIQAIEAVQAEIDDYSDPPVGTVGT